jgi:uncharacterized membrane protein
MNLTDDRNLPGHVDEAVQATARMHAANARSATPVERAFENMMALLARAATAGFLTVFVAAWVGANLLLGHRAFDTPPFPLLAALLTLFAVYMTIIILIVQRRTQKLGEHREQLMLQLALLSDQKSAKLIALIEELRRDDPLIRNRSDFQAEEFTRTVSPETVMEAIREGHEQQRDDATNANE